MTTSQLPAGTHVFLTPYRTRTDGAKYLYRYNVHEYDPHTNTTGAQLVAGSSDPEYDTCRVLVEKEIHGELYLWRNPRNYAIKVKSISKGAQLRTEENATVDLHNSKYRPMSEEQKIALRNK